jgi:hypothetical protein
MFQGKLLRSVPAALALACAATAQADQQLLGSFDLTTLGGLYPATEPHLQVLLVHDDDVLPYDPVELSDGAFWEDGQTGVVDFTASTHPVFDELAARLTDGLDELLYVLVLGPDGGGAAVHYESYWGFGAPDLVGNRVDLIRWSVDDLSIELDVDPVLGDYYAYELTTAYEFWGEPIPEPATLTLLAVGALTLVGQRRGLRQR